MKAAIERIFKNWKTTAAGTGVGVVVFTAFAATYHTGITWKMWVAAAVPVIFGAILKDPKSGS